MNRRRPVTLLSQSAFVSKLSNALGVSIEDSSAQLDSLGLSRIVDIDAFLVDDCGVRITNAELSDAKYVQDLYAAYVKHAVVNGIARA